MEFSPLTDDNDLLMIGQDTFTVSLLKTLTTKSLEKKHESPLNNDNPNSKFSILTRFKEHYFQSTLSLVEGMLSFGFAEINFTITSDIQQCKLLKFGDQNWQNGKMKIIGILKMDKENQGTKQNHELSNCFPRKRIIYYSYQNSSSYLEFLIETELLFCPEDLSNNESNES